MSGSNLLGSDFEMFGVSAGNSSLNSIPKRTFYKTYRALTSLASSSEYRGTADCES
jgi:hypothetical protein